ncbi:DNA cytosine methyltransferase [Hymenobacter fastidiosus]|uniref:DNA cytosine methyltransferase n=1 Tax=Hymenobacter fastidiosus TaxID=486264 RepID=UPI003CD07BA9
MPATLTHGALCNRRTAKLTASAASPWLPVRQASSPPGRSKKTRSVTLSAGGTSLMPNKQFLDVYDAHDLPRGDIISAGYPCQPESCAGKRHSPADDRWLWPEILRILAQCRLGWFLGENVAGHVTLGLDGVLPDLEAAGYEVWPLVLPAGALGAPHRRDRVCIIAHTHHRQPAQPEQALRPGRDTAGPGRAAAPDADSQRRGQPRGQPLAAAPGQGPRPDGRDYEPATTGQASGPDRGMGWVFT